MASKLVSKVKSKLKVGIEDYGCYNSPDFLEFAKTFSKMVREQLKEVGGTDYKQNVGHYYISGFFTVKEQPYYISMSDVRHFNIDNILIRTAKDYKDFTGGSNHYIKIQDNMFKDIKYIK